MTEKPPSKPDPRRERLEAELRENLKRRKEQARARRQPAAEESGPAAVDDEDV